MNAVRKNKYIAGAIGTSDLRVENLVMPFFVRLGRGVKAPIRNFPGVFHLSTDKLLKEVEGINSLGIGAVLLFGVCEKKDIIGSESWNDKGVVQQAIAEIKKNFPDVVVISDVCLCGYKYDGHCGIFKNGRLDVSTTLKYLAKIAVSHASSGTDFVAPSAMMPGQVEAIRRALDLNGFRETGIFAYSAKFASDFYGPFREALDSTPKFGDRSAYQLDYARAETAIKKIEQDIAAGADVVMVKPALAYLDVVKTAKEKFSVPLAAYNVSGEYSMVKLAASKGFADERKTVLEVLSAIKRAGADFIITYHARDTAKWLKR